MQNHTVTIAKIKSYKVISESVSVAIERLLT